MNESCVFFAAVMKAIQQMAHKGVSEYSNSDKNAALAHIEVVSRAMGDYFNGGTDNLVVLRRDQKSGRFTGKVA